MALDVRLFGMLGSLGHAGVDTMRLLCAAYAVWACGRVCVAVWGSALAKWNIWRKEIFFLFGDCAFLTRADINVCMTRMCMGNVIGACGKVFGIALKFFEILENAECLCKRSALA